VDVGLGDEVTEVGCDDVIAVVLFFFVSVLVFLFGGLGVIVLGLGIWCVGFPFFEDGLEFGFGAEETDAFAAITHSWF